MPAIRVSAVFLIVLFTGAFSTARAAGGFRHRLPDPQETERRRPVLRTPPTGGEIVSPAEFCQAQGVLMHWAPDDDYRTIIGDIAYAIAPDDMVYIVVTSPYYEQQARTHLISRGVHMPNVVFIMDTESILDPWIRDFGPFCIYEDGARAITDFFYGFGDTMDDVPMVLADYFDLPFYRTNILHHGGNHISDGNGMAFCSTNIWDYNSSYTHDQIREEFRQYLGVDSLIVVQPMLGDVTRHIDMFCKLLNDTLFVVGEYAAPADGYPGDFVRLNNLASFLGSLNNLDGRPFRVVRIPMVPYESAVNRTYTNALILNDKVLVPTYGVPTDTEALGIYQEYMPGCQVIGIDSRIIIYRAGAVHCVTSCLHAENPLVVFHQSITSLPMGAIPAIDFSLNPRFADSEASVFYRPASGADYVEVPAAWSGGRWRALLPAAVEDFSYFLVGSSAPGGHEMQVRLPANAPLEAFETDVFDPADVATSGLSPVGLRCWPNPIRGEATIRWDPATSGAMRLELLDVMGRPVRTWSDAGGAAYRIWDGTGDHGQALPAGVYFLRLQEGRHVQRRSVVVVP